MSTKVRSILGGQLHLQIHLWIHICVVPFEGPPNLWLKSHICVTLDDGGSILSPDPSPVLFISMLFALHLHEPYTVFFTFSCVCQIYVAEVLIIHFCKVLPSKIFITIWVPKWGQFWRSQVHLQIHICAVLLRVHSISDSNPIYVSH